MVDNAQTTASNQSSPFGQAALASSPQDVTTPDSDSAASPFTAPQISLPKGGGAIRGIDEKFTANPVTGTGSLSVPIALSPGRSGFGPQLSLDYDSGTGNGLFGMGWSLSMPSITRRTDKGCRGISTTADRIGKIGHLHSLRRRGPGPGAARDENGETRFDEFERDGYRVKRYRPRIEGLFARIERWTRLDDGRGALALDLQGQHPHRLRVRSRDRASPIPEAPSTSSAG